MRKKILSGLVVGILMMGLAATAGAAPLTPDSVAGSGTYKGALSLLYDGTIPTESTAWTSNTVYWNGTAPAFTFDYGQTYTMEDITLSVDNNDSYIVTYSKNNEQWTDLFTIQSDYGDIGVYPGGMDTMSTDSGNAEYVASINFTPVSAQYLRIAATGGDSSYSIGEFIAYGSPITSVPEPATMLLLGLGLLGVAGARRRIK